MHTMSGGIQLEVRVTDAPDCALLALPEDASGRVVSKSLSTDRETVREVLEVDSTVDHDSLPVDVETIFSRSSNDVLLYERPACMQCPCECVEEFGSPVAEAFTDNGCLTMRFYLKEVKSIRQVVDSLEESFDGVRVNHLIRTDTDHPATSQDIGFVDRGQLTQRQREALDTAHRMGYFDYPRQSNASEVASRMDISRSTFVEHLSRAQEKLLGDLFDTSPG